MMGKLWSGRGKCLEVSGKISNFALNESKTVRQPFLRLTRTFIFVRGATHVALVNWKRAPLYKRQALLTACEVLSHVVTWKSVKRLKAKGKRLKLKVED
jgi:hypothetical protein